MIQDIAPHKLSNHYVPGKRPVAESPCVCFHGAEVLIREPNETINDKDFGTAEAVAAYGDLSFLPTYGCFTERTAAHYLFTYDDLDVFLVRTEEEPSEFTYTSIRDVRRLNMLEKQQAFLLMTAFQVENWYLDNAFCGRCATATIHSPTERALVCPTCGRTIYPRILPAVIVGVIHDGHILLTKYEPKSGQSYPFYALVAGFTEVGETLEECVAREVMEETGLPVRNIRYYKSQPWGIVDDLLMGFFCEVDTDRYTEKDADGFPAVHLDANELRKAVWMSPEDMELQPDAFSMTNEMMMLFKAKRIASPSDLPLDLTRADIEELENRYYR